MTRLPAHRQIINGRTFARAWNPADFDPIIRDHRRSGQHWLDWTLVVIFVGLAAGITWGLL